MSFPNPQSFRQDAGSTRGATMSFLIVVRRLPSPCKQSVAGPPAVSGRTNLSFGGLKVAEDDALVDVRGLTVDFPVGRGRYFGLGRKPYLRAVDGVDLGILQHETVGLVGESGSGKTTTGRAIAGLSPISDGNVCFDAEDLAEISAARYRELRQQIQMVFQDPYSSLDPSWMVEDIVGEPLRVHRRSESRKAQRVQILDALEMVGLGRDHLRRYPHEFSGGQRQRIAIARAIVLEPEFIIFDEAVSALDVSTQSQVINLIKRIQDATGSTYLFIAHDLGLVRYISDRIAVMYLGKIVERGPSARVFDEPAHPYTEALLSAVSNPYVPKQRGRIILHGDPPSPMNPPSGCRFRTRCPYAMEVCGEVTPEETPVVGGGFAACHLHTEGPKLAGKSMLSISPDEVAAKWGIERSVAGRGTKADLRK